MQPSKITLIGRTAINNLLERSQVLPDVSGFRERKIDRNSRNLTEDEWLAALHGVEIKDIEQQIQMRPWFAVGIGIVLILQNVGIWLIVNKAMDKEQLTGLQLIFSTLVAGTLTQSYFILRLITERVFSDIDYHNK